MSSITLKKFINRQDNERFMLDEKLFTELELTLDRIRNHFLYTDELNDRALSTLNFDAISHSDKLEVDSTSKATHQRLLGAWDISLEHYNGTIDNNLICKVASEIDPRVTQYRNESVRVAGRQEVYVMTNPAKVEREMNKLLAYVNNPDIRVLERALAFHLYFALIHPLSDGNGRTSRLMQNMILYHNGIPPVTIKHTERPTYLDHIEDATKAFRERSGQDGMFENQSYAELRFIHYIQGKVNDSAEWLEEKMSNLRRYEVDVDLRGPRNTILGIRNVLRKALVAQGLPPTIQVSHDRTKMTIVTEQHEEFLVGLLERYKKNSTNLLRYQVKNTTKD